MVTLSGLVLLAGGALGCGFGDHHRPPSVAVCCDTCGVESAEVMALVRTLQCHPRWRTRDNAAHDLRDYDWRCHPEILAALSTAMLTDCEEEVREEAAESLAKIKPAPCAAEIHAALARVAECDPDHATRKWARKALTRVATKCANPCDICEVGPVPTSYAVGRPRPLFGRFLLPRQSGYIVPGSRVDLPVTETPTIISEPYPQPYGTEISPPITNEPPLFVDPPSPGIGADGLPAGPLEDLPPVRDLPSPNLPRAIESLPRETPPPPAEASPFLTPPPRAERSTPAPRRVASRESDAAARASRRVEFDRDDDAPPRVRREEPRRRLLPFSLLGRRGR